MPTFHAVVLVDHHKAQVLQLGADHAAPQALHEHRHMTKQHASGVRSEHEFFGEVCGALEGIAQVLVTGGHQSLADFKHYVEKHSAHTAKQIVGYQVVDHPSDKELAALARAFFDKHDKMAGIAVSR